MFNVMFNVMLCNLILCGLMLCMYRHCLSASAHEHYLKAHFEVFDDQSLGIG